MIDTERPMVLERLRDLEGWAVYIVEALTMNQRQEPVTVGMLERGVDPRALKEIRELSWSLYAKLHVLNTELELSRGEVVASLELRS
jgi:hypothetical protein